MQCDLPRWCPPRGAFNEERTSNIAANLLDRLFLGRGCTGSDVWTSFVIDPDKDDDTIGTFVVGDCPMRILCVERKRPAKSRITYP